MGPRYVVRRTCHSYPSFTRHYLGSHVESPRRRYPFYDNVSMVTHHEWGGWQYADTGAVRARRRIDECQAAQQRGRSTCSKRLGRGALDAIEHNGLAADVPPYPVVNGPMFAVSSSLGALIAQDPLPRIFQEKLSQTARVKAAMSRPGGPRKSNMACWPVSDATLGYWISRIASARNLSLTLVNSPFMVQHHPWPAVVHGAFSNSSIVLHGLKKERNQRKFYDLALRRGMGPFAPFRRKCGNCAALGWSSWPGSQANQWQCCGCDLAGESKAQCEERMGGAGGGGAGSAGAGAGGAGGGGAGGGGAMKSRKRRARARYTTL